MELYDFCGFVSKVIIGLVCSTVAVANDDFVCSAAAVANDDLCSTCCDFNDLDRFFYHTRAVSFLC